MKARACLAAMAAGMMALQPVLAAAEDGKPAPAPAPATSQAPASAATGPSAFVRCDGSPNKPSTLGTVARLVAITAVIGLLLPSREAADPKKRQSGADGIKACDDALTGADPAKDGGRRIELIFGRAIHRMELKDWDGALADLRTAVTDQPELTATAAYCQSLGLTALELEAMALTGKGDFAGAHAAGLRMAAQAPYDIKTMLGAIAYIRLTGTYGEAEQAYYDQLVRIFPQALTDRAAALAEAGRFADAARDYATLAEIVDSMPKGKGYPSQARAAIAWRLAGNKAEADRLDALAQERSARDVTEGKSDALAAATTEAGDLSAIIIALDAGQGMRARTLLSARSRWNVIAPGLVAEVARRLQSVGTPAEQANTPIQSPAEILAAAARRNAAVIDDTGEDNADRFNTYRAAFAPTEFNKFAANVWRTDKSKYIDQPKSPDAPGEFIDVSRNGAGVPGGYAMLLHLALVAKARGAAGFMIMPGQRFTYMHFFRVGTPGDGKVFAPVAFDPAKVIADLAPVIPEPVKKPG